MSVILRMLMEMGRRNAANQAKPKNDGVAELFILLKPSAIFDRKPVYRK